MTLLAALITGTLLISGCSTGESAQAGQSSSTVIPSAVSEPTTGAGGAPATTTSTSASTSTSSPAQSGLPPMPAAAKQHTDKGAEAFARYYLELYSELTADPTQGKLRGLALRTCKTCAKFDEQIRVLEQKKRRNEVPAASIRGVSTEESGLVRVANRQRANRVLDSNGRALAHIDEQDAALYVAVKWVDGRWKVSEIQIDYTDTEV